MSQLSRSKIDLAKIMISEKGKADAVNEAHIKSLADNITACNAINSVLRENQKRASLSKTAEAVQTSSMRLVHR